MAIPRLDGTSTNTPAAPQQAAPANPTPARSGTPAPGRAPTGAGGAIAPKPPEIDDSEREGGGWDGVKRDDTYWREHQLPAGTYKFRLFVNKIQIWANDEPRVEWKVIDWPKGSNRSGPHHTRPILWEQVKDEDFMSRVANGDEGPRKAYAYFRRDLVAAYASAGFREETWDLTADDPPLPVAPYYRFFVRRLPDGIVVPMAFSATVTVQPKREKYPPRISDLRVVAPPADSGAQFYQAPLPWEVAPFIAEMHGWSHERKSFTIPARDATESRRARPAYEMHVARVSKDAVSLGHAGLPTYKDM